MLTISELIANYRAALLGVLPSVQGVNIPWKRPDAYDEWDDIAAVLYEKLVSRVIEWSVRVDIGEGFRLPPYDMMMESYSELSTIEVHHHSLEEGRWVFHALTTEVSPFDSVEVRLLSTDGEPLESELRTCAFAGAEFYVQLYKPLEPPLLMENVKI